MTQSAEAYQLLDSGSGRKLERFGEIVLDRPCAQAVWRPTLGAAEWGRAHGVFHRESKNAYWEKKQAIPASWQCLLGGITFRLQLTDFGHVGVFPEHLFGWNWMADVIAAAKRPMNVLNLFAYSGGATLALAKAGCQVCHLDASKKMTDWARANASLNHLDEAPIRWIVDDVTKFLKREVRREKRYDGIILDPPSFGRGTNQELFKIETHLLDLLDLCGQVLSSDAEFLFISCHTPGYTPIVLEHLLAQSRKGGSIQTGEMQIAPPEGVRNVMPIPSGSYACWKK